MLIGRQRLADHAENGLAVLPRSSSCQIPAEANHATSKLLPLWGIHAAWFLLCFHVSRVHVVQTVNDSTNDTMAFDRPIDADKIRVEEFGLFSAFVHAPLWILGGVLGEKNTAGSSSFDNEDTTEPKNGSAKPFYKESNSGNVAEYSSSSSSSSPSRLKNPLHDDGGATMLAKKLRHTNLDSAPSNHDETQQHNSPTGLKRTKKMSWSDESGQSLVEYANEVSK